MTARIDHVVIYVGQQLDGAAEQYRRLGFTLTQRGHHSLGSSNHLAVFGSDYLELLGVEPQNGARFQYAYPTGLSGLVFKTTDSAALWADLSARGVPLEGTEPRAFFRPVELPDGQVQDAHFRTVRVSPEEIPNGRVFFCHHLTPQLVWRPEWQDHANGAAAIVEYAYVTPDPQRSAQILERVFPGAGVRHEADASFFETDAAEVIYLKREALAARYGIPADSLPPESERAVALTLRIRSLEQTRRVLQQNGVEGVVEAGRRLVVPPASAAGVVLAFEE